MAIDYKINLAKDLTSTPEERQRFYNGMLIYIAVSAIVLVGVAYLSSMNVRTWVENKREREHLLSSVTMSSGVDFATFKDPGRLYDELEGYSQKIKQLELALEQRVQLLPIVHNLFIELPKGVALQSLAANRNKVEFGLVMPPSSAGNDSVRALREAWEKNIELMTRVATIRPVTGERRTVGTESKFYVQFECILNK